MRETLQPVAVFSLVSYIGWVGLTFVSYYAIQARLFFAIFPALALLCAGGLAALSAFDSPALRLSRIVNAALALVFILSAVEHGLAFAAHSPLAYLAGAQTAADYRAAKLGWYAVAMDKVNALPPASRVVFLWEPRSLECAAPDRCDPDGNRNPAAADQHGYACAADQHGYARAADQHGHTRAADQHGHARAADTDRYFDPLSDYNR